MQQRRFPCCHIQDLPTTILETGFLCRSLVPKQSFSSKPGFFAAVPVLRSPPDDLETGFSRSLVLSFPGSFSRSLVPRLNLGTRVGRLCLQLIAIAARSQYKRTFCDRRLPATFPTMFLAPQGWVNRKGACYWHWVQRQ